MKEFVPNSPSLTQLKGFNIPGYVPPQKVSSTELNANTVEERMICRAIFSQFYSESGVQFHVNLPETILRFNLGDPKVSSMITRYPVYCSEDKPIW